MIALRLLALALPAVAQQAGEGHFFFEWPAATVQCQVSPPSTPLNQVIALTWTNATAPFSCSIIPMGGQPFMYNIPSSAYSNGQGSYNIQLQLNYGTNYVVQMSDANGIGSGGTAEIQQVGASNQTACLNTASKNFTASDFSFSVSGQAKQCFDGFDIAWTGSTANGPYNATIIPLDQGFFPFDVPFDNSQQYETNWQLNLTAGTRFTVMMNNKIGYGRGGVAGIYQVDTSTKTACVSQSTQSTGSWPVGIATNTLAVATLPATTSSSSSLSGGAIAGIVIGVLAALAIVLLTVFLLLRRRRRRRAQAVDGKEQAEIDLGGESEYTNPAPMVEPYRQVGSFPPPPGDEHQDHLEGETVSSSAGFAGLGAGRAGTAPNEAELAGEGEQRTGPGEATVLPSKSRTSRQSPLPRSRPAAASPSGKAAAASGLASAPSGGLHVVNHDDPEALPAVPAVEGRRRSGNTGGSSRQPRFRRHEDAGRAEEVVDLPPLYTDVPREREAPSAPRVGDSPGEGHARDPARSPGDAV